MMIRSQPPASAHFADRPVPAPAPMIGRPASICGAQPRECLGPGHARDHLVQPVRHRVGEGGVVDVEVELVQLDVVADAFTDGGEERLVRGRVVERSALRGDHRDALQRDEQRRRPLRGRELARDPAAELGTLLGRRPHQGDGGVVDVDVAAFELRRQRLARAEVDHVERAERDHLRQSELARRLQPVRPCRQHAADEVVRELGRRQVEDAGEKAAAGQRLHRQTARTGGVEHEHLVPQLLEPLARPRHRRSRDPEHRRPNQRGAASGGRRRSPRDRDPGHPRDRAGRVRQDPLRDPVQPGDVDDRVGHRHVVRPDVRARVPGCDGGHDQLRDADRQRLGGGGADRRVARAADGEDPVEPPLLVQPLGDRRSPAAHRLDGGAPVACLAQDGDVGAGRGRDLRLCDVGGDLRLEDARVDDQHVDALLAQTVAQVPVLLSLRVQRAQEDDGRHVDQLFARPERDSRRDSSRCSWSRSRSSDHSRRWRSSRSSRRSRRRSCLPVGPTPDRAPGHPKRSGAGRRDRRLPISQSLNRHRARRPRTRASGCRATRPGCSPRR